MLHQSAGSIRLANSFVEANAVKLENVAVLSLDRALLVMVTVFGGDLANRRSEVPVVDGKQF